MSFFQEPFAPSNPWVADRALRAELKRRLGVDLLATVTPSLAALGEAAAGPLAELAEQAEASPPRLAQYDPWGRRIDAISRSGDGRSGDGSG